MGMDTYAYKYYIQGINRHRVLSFLYDRENIEERNAFRRLSEIVLFYRSVEQYIAFELYLGENIELIKSHLDEVDRFNCIKGDEPKISLYKERLRLGLVLNKMLSEWRHKNEIRI